MNDGTVGERRGVPRYGADVPRERTAQGGDCRIAQRAAAEVRLVVVREGVTTRYDAFFPLAALGFDAGMLREGVRFNLQVNDNDGTGRDLLIETARGSFKDQGSSPLVRFH